MLYSQFVKQINQSDVVETRRCYGNLIERCADEVRINGERTEFKTLEEARQHIKAKTLSVQIESEISQETYDEISENTIAKSIKRHHGVRVTDTLIESYIDLASSKIFTTDPVAFDIRMMNRLDVVVENKIHYKLDDGSIVAINPKTQETLNNILEGQQEVVEFMRESKENFLTTVEQIKVQHGS